MTCIVGVADQSGVFIGGDSAGADPGSIQVRADPKVFKNGPFLFGFTSSFRLGDLLQHALKPPHHPHDMASNTYLCTVFIDAVRKTLKDGGFAKVNNNVEEGGQFLLGYQGRLYTVYQDFQICELADHMEAIGSGYKYALGSMVTNRHHRSESIIREALRAASTYDPYVCSPFHVLGMSPCGDLLQLDDSDKGEN